MRFRLYRHHSTGREYAGLTLSAPTADEAVRRAHELFAHLSGVRLVAEEERVS